jgi:hypothetical protein
MLWTPQMFCLLDWSVSRQFENRFFLAGHCSSGSGTWKVQYLHSEILTSGRMSSHWMIAPIQACL